MKEKIVVDTSIIIEYLKTGKGALPKAHEKYEMYMSSAIYIELLASSTFLDKELKKEVEEFINKYFVIDIPDIEIIQKSAEIIRGYGTTLAVAITAATCIIRGYKLLTQSEDFDPISEIEFVQI
jgi:predicted nucleic acid-binding protein